MSDVIENNSSVYILRCTDLRSCWTSTVIHMVRMETKDIKYIYPPRALNQTILIMIQSSPEVRLGLFQRTPQS